MERGRHYGSGKEEENLRPSFVPKHRERRKDRVQLSKETDDFRPRRRGRFDLFSPKWSSQTQRPVGVRKRSGRRSPSEGRFLRRGLPKRAAVTLGEIGRAHV